MLTLGNWIALIITAVLIIGFGIMITYGVGYNTKDYLIGWLITILATVIIVGGIALTIRWYNTSTASGVRAVKDWQSEINNGIDREITITAEDGRKIFHYQGKVDIESNHEDNYIKFESEEGKRYIIYYGIQDTITIIEQ